MKDGMAKELFNEKKISVTARTWKREPSQELVEVLFELNNVSKQAIAESGSVLKK